MLAAFESAASSLPPERVHVEYFTARDAAATADGFTVQLTRSGLELSVAPGQSILQMVEAAGAAIAYSCQEGVCVSCETGVLAGIPDHRDSVLSAGARARGDVMMICCSGSLDDRLVLDL